MTESKFHEPVLVHEIIKFLHIENRARVIDATLGTAGHTIEFLKRGANVLAIEADPKLFEIAEKRLTDACPTPNGNWGLYKLVLGNFIDIIKIAKDNKFEDVDFILFDLGISNIHYQDKNRGFSFENPKSKLDMRLNPLKENVKAYDLLNLLREDQLMEIFSQVMTKGKSKKLSKNIIDYRKNKQFKYVSDLNHVVKGFEYKKSLNKLTLPMMALRIAVNCELDNLDKTLPDAFALLRKGGRLAVISFHSGEDRIVKSYFRKLERDNNAEILTKKPIIASKLELQINNKARSAKLRIIKKINNDKKQKYKI